MGAKEKRKKESDAKERTTKERKNKKSKERRTKEKKEKEGSAKIEKVRKEKTNKEGKAKELVKKEKSSKETKAKETRNKEVAKKERYNKERNSKEKKTKEVNAKKEKVEKEKLPKERKAKELRKKEALAKEQKIKERKKKEATSKEARTKEGASKERRSKEANAKETRTKERKSKEQDTKERKAKANEKKQKTGPPSGKLKDHCIDAAKKCIQDVIKEVKNSQAMLDALDNGASCTTDKCRCAAATVALKEFRVATAMDAARKAAVVRDTKVICITKANGDKRKVAACHRMTINDITMAKYKPQLKLRPATMASGVSVRACKATIKPTIKPVAPADPCKKWKAEYKANAEIAKALKAEVRFGGGSTKLKDQGKKTLDNVAKILNKYPWMTITVEGHSDAPKGARCTALTVGRAAETEKYLKSKGVKNKMTRPIGKCGKKRAIEIIGNAAGRKAPPKGCNKAEFDEEDYGMQLLQKTNAAAQCRDPSFKANLLKSRSVKKKLTITKTKLVSSVKTAVCGSKENKQKEAANKERTNKEKSSKEKLSKEKRTKESSSKEGGSKEGTNREKKAKEVRTKAKLETVNKEKKSKELRSKEQKIKEKSAKDEKKNKELRGKE